MFFGGQYNHLILKNLSEMGIETRNIEVYEEPEMVDSEFDGIILGGGPQTLPRDLNSLGNSPKFSLLNKPVLGICLGHQLLSLMHGGELGKSTVPEFGNTIIEIINEDTVFKGIKGKLKVWESHNVEVIKPPNGFSVIASSNNTKVQAISNERIGKFGVQFHPEVKHTEKGKEILENFIRFCKK